MTTTAINPTVADSCMIPWILIDQPRLCCALQPCSYMAGRVQPCSYGVHCLQVMLQSWEAQGCESHRHPVQDVPVGSNSDMERWSTRCPWVLAKTTAGRCLMPLRCHHLRSVSLRAARVTCFNGSSSHKSSDSCDIPGQHCRERVEAS